MFIKEKKQNINENIIVGLLCFVSLSYPILLNLVIYNYYKIIVFSLILIVVIISFFISEFNKFNKIPKEILVLLFLYCTYMFVLFKSSYDYLTLYQYSIMVFKFLFFIFILFYLNNKIIINTLKIYSYICVLIVLINILIAVGVYNNYFSDFEYLTDQVKNLGYNFRVYFGSFYHLSNLNILGFEIYRFQGLSEEAGTFALSLYPAYLYFIFFDKNKYKIFFLIITFGLCMSMSFVTMFFLPAILILILYKKEFIVAMWLLISYFLFLFLFYINEIYFFIQTLIPSFERYVLTKSMFTERLESGSIRLDEIKYFFNYMINLNFNTFLFGIGSGNAFTPLYNHSLSIGWIVKFVEAGIIGGGFYLITFLLIVFLSLKRIIFDTNFNNISWILNLTVIIIITISSLRQPADVSFWHMWIYAFFIYNYIENKNEHTN